MPGGGALLETARALKAVLDPLGVPLLINDRVDVAHAAGAGLPRRPERPAGRGARAILGPDAILGVSLDDPEQARAVDPALVDYVAHGPFAATATKADAGGPVGAAGLAAARRLTGLPLIAIAGIDALNAAAAMRAGADGVAVVSAIMAAADPEAASRELRAVIDAARAEAGRGL